MEIPITSGIYADNTPDYRIRYPVNMYSMPLQTGVSDGYLKPADGIVDYGTGPGLDRGGINWEGVCYRVMGSKLVSIPATGGTPTTIGDVGGTIEQCNFAYSFDYLAIASAGNLWLYDGTTLTQNTDPDLGTVLDVIFVDGYFMTTDGEFLIVTDLGNPFSVNPLKYGSSELDPDPVVGLLKINNEPYAVNRHTVEIFQNIGGTLFPFDRIEGTRLDRGAVGTNAFALYMQSIAFVGNAAGEAPGVYIGANAGTRKISTREIDKTLKDYTEAQLSQILVEVRVTDKQQLLYIHLPDKTLVYDGETSLTTKRHMWFTLSSNLIGTGAYRARNFVFCDEKWLCGDTDSFDYGYLDESISSHFGDIVGWEFRTLFLYNQANNAIVNELELVSLPGRVPLGVNPTIWLSYSDDAVTFSQERPITAGMVGERYKRLVWRKLGRFRNYRVFKFRGTSDAHITVNSLEAQIEGLAY